MSESDERAAFEVWATSEGIPLQKISDIDVYKYHPTRAALIAFQAGRASVAQVSDSHARLFNFYAVETLADLVDMQMHHIEKLQDKLQQYPDANPNMFRVNRPREG